MARQQNSKTRRLPHARHNEQLVLKNVVFIHVRGGSRGTIAPLKPTWLCSPWFFQIRKRAFAM